MPLFLPEDEFRLISHDPAAVAERADGFIRDLRRQIDVVRAEADATSIAAEQTCALLEQKYASLSSDFSRLQSENTQLSASVEERVSKLADAQAEKHQLHLKAIGKDGEIEMMSLEAAELHKSKRQLLEILVQKDAEISEKNATIQSYLDKIVNMTENTTSKEARLHETEAELVHCHATCSRVAQEKELLEKHNVWLNEEFTAKVNSLVELRRIHMDVEADMSTKLADLERQFNESSSSLKWSKERVKELELRVNSLEEELYSSKDAASANEEQFAAELSTVTKLVELYKASSDEWSKKAGELEGVIKALERHLSQVENDYKEKLEKEIFVSKDFQKEAMDLREKLEKCETEIENTRKSNELSLLQISSFHADSNVGKLWVGDTDSGNTNEKSHMIVPKVPIGVSGTALAASLLRDGWSLVKMYKKYQEVADALRHEKWGRKHSEAILQRVLHEIEEKVEVILYERAEHERMVEAYTLMDQKLQQALLVHDNFENTIRKLKSELKIQERDCNIAQKEINDLQKQVTVLLKECQDVQICCGVTPQVYADYSLTASHTDIGDVVDAEKVISERLLTFKDINGLVEQNVQLRSLVRNLSSQEEKRDAELREGFQIELQKVTDEAAAKVESVMKRSEEQGSIVESLHSSVAMYKRLYEEERKILASTHASTEPVLAEDGKKELMLLFEGSQEVSKKSHEQLSDRARNLEQDLASLRSELMSIRLERDKMYLEANFAKERLDSFIKEFEHQRQEGNAVAARNVELTRLFVDYQKRLRESSDSLQASEENSRKLSMEVSILKHEREILIHSEKKASDEVRSLSERVHRLQSSLDTIQSAEEVRENARATESRKHDEYLKRVERDWAEAKKELQEERDHVRALTLDRENAVENSVRQVEEMRKELADAWRAVASSESRAAVAETRCSDLETKINHVEKKFIKKVGGNDHSVLSTNEVNGELWKLKEEMDKLKEEARANKDYMLQYKEIANINEVALKQIESAHEEYKSEAEKLKNALEDEVQSLRSKLSELEGNYKLKSEEAASAIETKENALSSAIDETFSLRDEVAVKSTHIEALEIQVSSLKDDLDNERKCRRTAQDNYERQVILQSETIQEMTNTSKEMSLLQSELANLRKLSEAQKTENDLLKVSWEKEKSELQELRNEAERKYNEINEQNEILHNRLETLHIRLADKEHSSAGISSQSVDSQADCDLQNVISYLRQSKEIAETEISLLKQEKLRLQLQLESALKASETAQALLHSQCENSRTLLFKDEEFKSLQLQVREINLLRESNMQLREENKHNFEECQKFRKEAQMDKLEADKIGNLLREKQIEFDACQKEVELQKMEIGHLNNIIAELHERNKNIDPEEYERVNNELQHIKVLLEDNELEIQKSKNLVSEKQEFIFNLEQVLATCQLELSEQEKKLNDTLQVEANIKLESEKQKNVLSHLKKRNETLTKEKEELNYKNQALSKQIEDAKSYRKTTSESPNEQTKKEQEKDTRIQILEKTLEREREDLRKERDDNRKERLRRQKTERTVLDLIQTVNKDKKRVEEELARHKHAIVTVLESSGVTASQLPAGSTLDEQTSAYFQSIGHFEEAANSFLIDGVGTTRSLSADLPIVDTSTAAANAGRQVLTPQMSRSTPLVKVMEERENGSTILKPSNEVRKAGRRLVRPRLEHSVEPTVDTELSGMEGSTTVEGGKASSSHDPDISSDSLRHAPLSRKRLASSSVSEPGEESASQDEASTDVAPLLKKSRDSQVRQDCSELIQSIPPSSENPDTVQQPMLPPCSDISDSLQPPPEEDMEADQTPALSNEEIIDMAKDDEDKIAIKEETEEQQKELLDVTVQEDELQSEGDAIVEELLDDKPSAEECLKSEDVKEMLQSAIDESEDEREEGELMPDVSEEQQDDEAAGGQHESIIITGDGAEVRDEAGDAVEVASPNVPGEKIEEIDIVEDVAEGSDKYNGNSNDQGGALDSVQSPQTSSGAREGSPVSFLHSGVSEQQSPTHNPTLTHTSSSAASETDETEAAGVQTRSGRTISITERARQNALLRQARLPTQPPPRGRGRPISSFRRESSRGSRGGRPGRGQSFGDREQS